MGGDDTRLYLFCPVVADVVAQRATWRCPGWMAGGDMRSLLYCLPLDLPMTVTRGVALRSRARGAPD